MNKKPANNYLLEYLTNYKFKPNYEHDGYDAEQVDHFLDHVISHVINLQQDFVNVKKENDQLQQIVATLKTANQTLQQQIKTLEESGYQLLAQKAQTTNPK